MPLVDIMKLGTISGRIIMNDIYSANGGFDIEVGYHCQGHDPEQWSGTKDGFKEKHDEICACGGVVSRIRDTKREELLWEYVEECVKDDVHPVFDICKYTAWYVNVTDQHIETYESTIREIWSIFNELDERGVVYIVNFENNDFVQEEFYKNRPIMSKTKSAAKLSSSIQT